jgi:hypothetical protein
LAYVIANAVHKIISKKNPQILKQVGLLIHLFLVDFNGQIQVDSVHPMHKTMPSSQLLQFDDWLLMT